MIRAFPFIVFFFIVINLCTYSQPLEKIAPDSAAGWTKSSPGKIYTGDELFALIDGGADIFFEYGFKKVLSQSYNKGDNYINVEIYEMTDSSSAFGIFSLQTIKTGEKINFSCEAFAGEGFLLFWKGNYYITLSSSSSQNSSENLNGLLSVAEGIQAKISSSGKPVLSSEIEKQFGTKAVYLKGYLSVYNLYLFTSENIFNVKDGCYFERESIKTFIFQYNNDEEAANQFQSANAALKVSDSLLSQQADNADRFLFKENNGKFITTEKYGKYILAFISEEELLPVAYIDKIKNILIK